MQIVPLTSDPNQTINVTLNVNSKNIPLQLNVSFNESANYWVMQIVDPATSKILIDNVPLITGYGNSANILDQYSYMEIGNAYILNVGNSPLDYPDAETIGTDFILLWDDNK